MSNQIYFKIAGQVDLDMLIMFAVSTYHLFNANSAIFRLYHGANKLIFNEMMMKSALYQTNTLSCIFYSASSLKQQSADRHIAPLGHIILIAEPSNLCPFSLMMRAYSGEATNTNFIVFGLTRPRGSNPLSTTLKASMLTILPTMRLLTCEEK